MITTEVVFNLIALTGANVTEPASDHFTIFWEDVRDDVSYATRHMHERPLLAERETRCNCSEKALIGSR